MLIKHRGHKPVVHSSVYMASTAVIVGKTQIGPRSRIMYGATLDSEDSRIEIGECTIICENTVLRATASCDREYPVLLGNHVFVGPHATLLGCTIDSCSYIATGATVLHGAVIHSGAVVAVGALVHAKAVVPKEFFVPPYNIAMGTPIKLYSPDEKENLINAIKSIGFAKTAFDVEAQGEDRLARYQHIAEVRSKEFESHFQDEVLQQKNLKTKKK